MHTAIVCQHTRLRGLTAPLRQDFARCIEPEENGKRNRMGREVRGEVFAHKNFRPSLRGAFAKRGEFRQQICLTRRREEREGKSL